MRTTLMTIESNTAVGPITDPLFAADQNQRRSLEAQRKLLSAIENAGSQGLGYRPWWRKARVSPSTLQTWRPKFLDQRLVLEDSPGHYVFNQKPPRPVPLESFSVKLPLESGGEAWRLFQVRRGHLELTAPGEKCFSGIIGKADVRNTAKDLAAHQLVDEINWLCTDGIHYNLGYRRERLVDADTSSRFPLRDPRTGQRLEKGDGDCPCCETGTMKKLQRCPVCGHQEVV